MTRTPDDTAKPICVKVHIIDDSDGSPGNLDDIQARLAEVEASLSQVSKAVDSLRASQFKLQERFSDFRRSSDGWR